MPGVESELAASLNVHGVGATISCHYVTMWFGGYRVVAVIPLPSGHPATHRNLTVSG